MGYSSKSNILNTMMLLKGPPIYEEFQSNTTVAPKPATNQNHLRSFWERCQRGFYNVDYGHHLLNQILQEVGLENLYF